ncbi:50S ribosomal protein L4 [Longimicrobium sp.]|uniref:50S ribosomal protein L4 n=1 Tax=Longimicrobium sp. TaxID=2029185 RepID=UPI002B5670DE|nr:50S ribosomal protein L4 [Longimicrobium sp.]HSU13093.1 50S ribosomal protein L4 [Longimicrobium sp.]
MLTARYYNAAGEQNGDVQLPEELFDGRVHEAALHQTVKAYLANQRQGTAATKTRGMVSGGNRKAWRQKGTGRARQGSMRAPHWRGGGIVFGPSPRSYHQDVPRKVKSLARRSAFNQRAIDGQIAVIERLAPEAPRTRAFAELLGKIGVAGAKRVLILTDGSSRNVYLSARNLPNVEVMPFAQASAYDVMVARQVVIEQAALDQVKQGAGQTADADAEEVVNA